MVSTISFFKKNQCKLLLLFTILNNIRGFHKHTPLAIMPILASEALLCENKKYPVKNVTPSGNRTWPLITSDSKSNTILSTLTCHVLFDFLDLDDLAIINRA